MIRHAQISDIPGLKKIWKKVFGDKDVYIDEFFAYAFSPENVLCYQEGNEAAAVLYKLPCLIRGMDGQAEKAYYFYALATLKEYRGQGIMSRLIMRAKEEIRREGCRTIFLIPATDSLLAYYEPFGFRRVIRPQVFSLKGESFERKALAAQEIRLEEAWPEEGLELASRTLWRYTNKNVFFEEKTEALYCQWSFRAEDSFLYKIIKNDKIIGYLEGKTRGGEVWIQNYGIHTPHLEAAAGKLLALTGEERLKILAGDRLPGARDGFGVDMQAQTRPIAVCSSTEWKQLQGFILE
ncbi:MAG: GNAT family N-acetyltransferase [Eubacteriales bacterium]|nr:GNAT family N-acetyltransferase [Eubacteriales bacterium]